MMKDNYSAAGKYISPDMPGSEPRPQKKYHDRPQVNNLYCPRDGHYCEQPDCGNCMGETVGDDKWMPNT